MKSTILRITLLAATIFAAIPCLAESGYKQLFHSVANKLSQKDQRTIYSALELQEVSNGKFLISDACEVSPEDFDIQLQDINGDGVAEVFVIGGNSCTSGVTGSSIWLFIKSKQQNYQKNLAFPAAGYKLLRNKNQGFPDIQVTAAGFCDGVWRWNRQSYVHHKNVATGQGGCDLVPLTNPSRGRLTAPLSLSLALL